ncbi:MAG: FtsW/RodA/SpoVE family cell cycle protein [Phycisphaerae bacterium]
MPESTAPSKTRRDAIVIVAYALLVLGLVAVASATASPARPLLDSLSWHDPFGRQSLFVLVGAGLMLLVSRLAPGALGSASWQTAAAIALGAVAMIGLALPLIPGLATQHRGALRWLQFSAGGATINIQPSEFCKLAMVVFLAWWTTLPNIHLRSLRQGFLPVIGCVGVCAALVGREDVGTAGLMAVVAVLVLIVAGCRWTHLGLAGLLGAGGLAGLIYFESYRWKRVTAYLNLDHDPLGSGYQPLQSLTTIASGGWFGVGLGAGIQKHGYLPESHTDFVFAMVCEEMGVFGGFVIIGLFATMVWLGIKTMRTAATEFERLLAFGLTSMIAWQAVMNIAVVTVVTPTTGISLPLISAGGSGILTYSVMIGLLAAIAFRGQAAEPGRQKSLAGGAAIRFGTASSQASMP